MFFPRFLFFLAICALVVAGFFLVFGTPARADDASDIGGPDLGGGPQERDCAEAGCPPEIIIVEPPPDIIPVSEPPPPVRTQPDSFPAPSVNPFCISGTESKATVTWDNVIYGTQGVHVQVDDDGDWGNGFWWDTASPIENTREIPDDNGRPLNTAQPPFRRLVFNPGQTYYARIYSLEWAVVGPEVSFSAACALPPDALTLSCSASPLEPTNPDTITWSVVPSGGTPPFSYSWSGTDGLSGTSASVQKTYTTTGIKEGRVIVVSSDGSQETCTQSLFVWPPEGIVVNPFCAGAESKANISWRLAGPAGDGGFFVDIDDDQDWNNGFWNKFVPAGTNETVAPDAFNPSGGAFGSLIFNGETLYRARVYYVFGARHTPVNEFNARACAGPPAPFVSLTADGLSFVTIPYNGSASLSWNAGNADSCTASGSWSGTRPLIGSEPTGNLTSSQMYTLTCAGHGGSAKDTARINVSAAPSPELTLYAAPSIISRGEETDLVWSAANIVSCSIDQGIGSVDLFGTRAVRLSQTTTYTLTCGTVVGGLVSTQTTIQVRSRPTFQEVPPRQILPSLPLP